MEHPTGEISSLLLTLCKFQTRVKQMVAGRAFSLLFQYIRNKMKNQVLIW